MSIYADGDIIDVHWDGPIDEIWDGSKMVWSSVPVEVFRDHSSIFGLRDQMQETIASYGLNHRDVIELPFRIDTSQLTKADWMFEGCSSLVTVPEMDLSNATSVQGLFNLCSSLVTVPEMDLSNATSADSVFAGCSSLVQAPDLDVSKATRVNSFFARTPSLKDGNARLIRRDGTLPSARHNIISGSGLTREPFFRPNGTPIN